MSQISNLSAEGTGQQLVLAVAFSMVPEARGAVRGALCERYQGATARRRLKSRRALRLLLPLLPSSPQLWTMVIQTLENGTMLSEKNGVGCL